MQDEIIKHTKKIYKTARNSKHSFTEKITEIAIEIFIIVFAVSLSIGLHSWNEHRHQQKLVREFLTDLKSELNKDLLGLEEGKKEYDAIKKSIASLDDTTIGNFSINYIIRVNNNANYEGFKSSGKISTIENKKLKNLILEYYQKTNPSTYNLDNIFNAQVKTIADESNFDSRNMFDILNEKKYNRVLKRLEYYIEHNKVSYDAATKQIKEIMEEIEKETNG
jgi:hypothetical protein